MTRYLSWSWQIQILDQSKIFEKFIHVHPMQMEKHNINQCFIETYFDK